MPGLGAASEPSMEEILASIRKIIAEDADGPRLAPADADLAPPVRPDDGPSFATMPPPPAHEADFELPSILRSSPAAPADRASGMFNRLADALLGGQSASAPASRPADLARSLEDDLADLLEGAVATRSPVATPPPVRIPPAQSPLAGEAPPAAKVAVATPEAQRLFASLDESLAMLADPRQSRDGLRDLATRAPLISVGAGGSPLPDPPMGFGEGAPNVQAARAAASGGLAPSETAGDGEPASLAAARATIAARALAAAPPAVRNGSPALAELSVRERGSEPAEPPPIPKAKAPNGAAPTSPSDEAPRPGAGLDPSNAAGTTAGRSPAPPPLAGPPATVAEPTRSSKTATEPASPPPVAPASAEAIERTAASVISAADFFINGVAGKARAGAGGDANPVPGAGALDAAAAELLRPMLKQWLAENMPRIVEAALRAEIAKVTDPNGKG